MEELTLIEKLKQYEKITKEIDLLSENEYQLIDEKINMRQYLLDSINEEDKFKANKIYFDLELDKLDDIIRKKIVKSLDEVKEEIKEYRKTKIVNSMYSRNSREKLNIFSKKV